MPDDKSSDEFFMKIRKREKREEECRLFRDKNRSRQKRYRCNWTSNCRQVLLACSLSLALSMH